MKNYILIISLLLICNCAPEVIRYPSNISTQDRSIKEICLTEESVIYLSTGYRVTLKRGSIWEIVGVINEGNVYRPENQILTVEGANIHEAYIVLSDKYLTGFYLPVERAFSPLTNKQLLFIQERKK